MLEKCVRDQWSVDDLDWSVPPPQLSREKEEAVVQYFTDMAGIELLAGALFESVSANRRSAPARLDTQVTPLMRRVDRAIQLIETD